MVAWQGAKGGRERREYELPKEDMRGAGVARMGEGVMEHKRAGMEESSFASSSSESSDSNALKRLIGVENTRDRGGKNYSREERESVVGKGGSGVESGEGVDKNGGA